MPGIHLIVSFPKKIEYCYQMESGYPAIAMQEEVTNTISVYQIPVCMLLDLILFNDRFLILFLLLYQL